MTNQILRKNDLQQIANEYKGEPDIVKPIDAFYKKEMSNHPYNQIMIDETISSRRGGGASKKKDPAGHADNIPPSSKRLNHRPTFS